MHDQQQDPLDLVVPVYLDERRVLDLVAMFEGGLATVTRVTEGEHATNQSVRDVGGGIGSSSSLAHFVKVSLTARLAAASQATTERSTATERVHTAGSLFYTLWRALLDRNAVTVPESISAIRPGQFVEFTATLRRNPLLEVLESMLGLLDFAVAVGSTPQNTTGKSKQGSSARSSPEKGTVRQEPKQKTGTSPLREQLSALAERLVAGGTQDLVADLTCGHGRAVLTLERDYLGGTALSDVVDGTFRVFGKVTHAVPDANGSVNLLRKTPFAMVPDAVLNLEQAFAGVKGQAGLRMPEMELEVKGPVMQVLPIGIFV